MASPIGHAVVGIGIAAATASALGAGNTPALWLGGAVASCAPDLDLLPSLWGVPYWRVHRKASHSILVLAGLVMLAWATWRMLATEVEWRCLVAWGAALASHVVLDILCTGPASGERGHGIPLFWPVTSRRWYVLRPILPETNFLENPPPAAVVRACLWELLHLCPAAGTMMLLAQLV